jgi:hypothetical protein
MFNQGKRGGAQKAGNNTWRSTGILRSKIDPSSNHRIEEAISNSKFSSVFRNIKQGINIQNSSKSITQSGMLIDSILKLELGIPEEIVSKSLYIKCKIATFTNCLILTLCC